jgi:hypothetical protein
LLILKKRKIPIQTLLLFPEDSNRHFSSFRTRAIRRECQKITVRKYPHHALLWIGIGFNADLNPDPAFYLNADPDPRSQTNPDPDPDPGQTLKFQKVEF